MLSFKVMLGHLHSITSQRDAVNDYTWPLASMSEGEIADIPTDMVLSFKEALILVKEHEDRGKKLSREEVLEILLRERILS
jgi:hypothetical protein